jgi:two-component system chemotaxis sensor kinase CheA
MSFPNLLDTFFHEAEDLLQQIEEVALELCQADSPAASSSDAVNHLFRAFHTIKGSGGMCGLDEIANFTHHLESALDRVRAGKLTLSPALARLVLEARDVIRDLLAAAISGGPAPHANAAAVIAALDRLCSGAVPEAPGRPVPEPARTAGGEIYFRPPRDLTQRGMDPEILLSELRGLGPLEVCGSTEAIPALEQMDPRALSELAADVAVGVRTRSRQGCLHLFRG